jgi:hypothetical protein
VFRSFLVPKAHEPDTWQPGGRELDTVSRVLIWF